MPYLSDVRLVSSVSSSAAPAKFFAPNRQVPSPVVLGTIPSSLTNGWQTLTFCPNSARTVSGVTHPGTGASNTPSATGAPYTVLPDHLLLDLFWMPVAEPYAISEQFSAAGKVNLNYAMMPFPYIQRKTALDAVLKSVWLTALPSDVANFPAFYKSYGVLYQTSRLDQTHTRFLINVDATLKAFDYKFGKGDIFRSATQICDVFLYPNSPTAASPNPPGPWTATEAATAPSGLRGLTYVAFQMRADGSTKLPAQDSAGTVMHWCLSLRAFNAPALVDKSLPAPDFACLVLDPDTGCALTFRP